MEKSATGCGTIADEKCKQFCTDEVVIEKCVHYTMTRHRKSVHQGITTHVETVCALHRKNS